MSIRSRVEDLDRVDLTVMPHSAGQRHASDAGRTMGLMRQVESWPRERLAQRVSAASYGTVLVLASLALLDADEVASGLGWELVTGVGVATWVAHLYAEVVGDHIRHTEAPGRRELVRAMIDGLPILLAAVAPGVMLLLGRLDVLPHRLALWAAVAVAFLQLVTVGILVGSLSDHRASPWRFAAVSGAVGLVVVALKIALGH
jgi:hypothetical protein